MKNLVFLSDISEAIECKAAIKEKKMRIEDTLFISFDMSTRKYIEEAGFNAATTLDYFDNTSHEKTLETSKKTMQWIRENSFFKDMDLGIKKSFKDWFAFWVRFTIHHCLYLIEIVSNAVDKHNPESIYGFSVRGTKRSLYLEHEEGFIGYFAKLIAEDRGIRFVTIKKTLIKYSADDKQLYGLIKYIARYARFKISAEKFLIKKIKRPIFITTIFYQMDRLAEDLRNKLRNRYIHLLGGPVTTCHRIPDIFFKILCRKYYKYIYEQREEFKNINNRIINDRDVFLYRGVVFAKAISKKLVSGIFDHMLSLMAWTRGMDSFIGKSNPSFLISNGNRDDDISLAELCAKRNIPTLLVSHGSLVEPKNEYETIEWGEQGKVLMNAPFSYVALQSPLSDKYLDKIPSGAKKIKTGLLIWGRNNDKAKSKALFDEIFKGKYEFGKTKVILHAGTPMPVNSLRLYVYETPDEYVKNIQDLADTVEGMENTVLIIKFRESKAISIGQMKYFLRFSDKVILSTGQSFADMLGLSDLIVSFSSTTIEESLQGKVPVLLYGCNGRYEHLKSDKVALNSKVEPLAIYHVVEKENLGYALREILKLDIKNKNSNGLFSGYSYKKQETASLTDFLKQEGAVQK